MGWHPPLPDVLARGAVVNRECRLSLARLHAAAPGVLDAIACFDGDFQEAPIFHPPLWDGSRWMWDYDWSDQPTGGLFLDLRIPSVAARLAGLCARAFDPRAEMAMMIATGTADHGFIALRWASGLIGDERRIWNRGTGGELSSKPTGILLPPRCDSPAALSATTLALAPRIAALGVR